MVLGRPKLGHWAINKIVSCWHYDDRVDWLPWYTCRGRRGAWPGWGGRRAASAAARSSRTQSCRRLSLNKQLFTSQQILCQLSNLLNIIYLWLVVSRYQRWKSVSVCVLYFDQCSPRTPRQKPGQLRAGSSGSRANRDKKRLNRTRLDIDRIIIINCCYLPVLCRIYLLQGPTNNDK